MKFTLLTSLCAACASVAIVSAQAPSTSQPTPQSPTTQPPTTQSPTPQSPTSQMPSTRASADTVTLQGCVDRGMASTATPGATGTSGTTASSNGFVLNNVTRPSTSGASGTSGAVGTSGSSAAAAIASSYRLDADESKLSPHVGHKVEITGTIEPPDRSAASGTVPGVGSPPPPAAAAPRLKVDTVKMIAETCTMR